MTPAVVTATLILFSGVIDDFRSRKFHNWLFIICTVVALAVALISHGPFYIGMALAGFIAGIVVFLPLVLLNVLGAGDMKLMAAFGIVAGWEAVIEVGIYSIFWAAGFGVLQVIIKGQFMGLVRNLGTMAINRGRAMNEVHRIPFTAALFVGWLTHLMLQGRL